MQDNPIKSFGENPHVVFLKTADSSSQCYHMKVDCTRAQLHISSVTTMKHKCTNISSSPPVCCHGYKLITYIMTLSIHQIPAKRAFWWHDEDVYLVEWMSLLEDYHY